MSTAKGWQFEGGNWIAAESLPLTDRAVRYGMSVFESIGVRDGQPLLAAQHLALLGASARRLLFPAESAADTGGATTLAALPLPGLDPHDRGMLRLYVTAGDGGPADSVRQPRIFAFFENLSDALPDEQTARLHPAPVTPFADGAKSGNYWVQCAAQAAARAEGFDHALLFDNEGRLLSGAMGNVFFVKDGRLCTPSLSLAVRSGVLRGWVMEEEPTRELEFTADRLEDVEEIFLTNSRLGVMPLRFANAKPGPVGCGLRDRCRREKIIP